MKLYSGNCFEVIFCDWCQEFPGQCIVSCDKERLSDLTGDDWVELGCIEKELERICNKCFNSTMYNFACLMNNSYKDKEKHHVHFHFIPRYDGERIILNKKYKDRHFGYNMWKFARNKFLCQKDIFSQEERENIGRLMITEWSIKNESSN